MAIIKDNNLVGIIGPVIFKKRKGKQTVSSRMKPGTMKQSQETIRKANVFGLSSKFTSEIMDSFKISLNGFQDGEMFNRLTKRLLYPIASGWDPEKSVFNFDEQNFHSISGFDFNIKAPITSSFGADTQVTVQDELLSVAFFEKENIPLIKFPNQSITCELTVSVCFFRLDDGLKTRLSINQSQIIKKFRNELAVHEFQFKVPDGCLCVVSTFLHFYMINKKYMVMVNNKQFSPAAINAVIITSGIYDPADGLEWMEMPGLKLA